MCYEPTARPPLPPIAGGSGLAGSEETILEAADGNRFSAFSARTDGTGERDDRFEFRPHVMRTTPDQAARDVAAAVAHVRSHSFFDRSAAQHREASEDAWRRMLAFIHPGAEA